MTEENIGEVHTGADDASAELKELLTRFAGDLPPAAIMGSYSFAPGDPWREPPIATAQDGWYTFAGWSIRMQEGVPQEAQRIDLGEPPGTVKL